MRYFALATDYDGTLAHDGVVDAATTETLIQLQASGRSLILVTGREIDDLQSVFDRLDLFAWVVAENGALLYEPSTRDEFKLAEPIDPRFAAALKRKGIEPLSTGRVIVATREPHEATTLQTIRDLGLELQVIFNKGAVMVLPTGVNKGTGLVEALKRLELSPHNVAGVGDAENDHGFLDMCELSAAVKNALPAVKERATITLKGARGDGVQELAAAMLKDDLRASSKKNGRTLLMGETNRGALVEVPVFEKNLLLAGSSGGGKSTLAKAFLERLYEQSYQFCVIDPEGDYESFEAGVVLGDRTRAPLPEEALQVLSDPEQNLVLNLLGVPLDERPKYFNTLIAELLELRARTGRPHWIVIDEAHHVLPEDSHRSGLTLSKDLTNIVMITVEPGSVLHSALDLVDMVFTVGQDPSGTMRAFAKAAKRTPPPLPRASFEKGEALVWETSKKTARRLEVAPSSFEHHRHKRKYATGDVGEQYSFYFRGPNEELNLPARNLIEFLRIARGID
ncbi:MAG: HAD-IIB family hydrolase, partial [Dehalococcoidia bacterium]